MTWSLKWWSRVFNDRWWREWLICALHSIHKWILLTGNLCIVIVSWMCSPNTMLHVSQSLTGYIIQLHGVCALCTPRVCVWYMSIDENLALFHKLVKTREIPNLNVQCSNFLESFLSPTLIAANSIIIII